MSRFKKNTFNKLFIFLLILLIQKGNSLISFTHPSAISLPNNNFFIVEQNGVYVYDQNLANVIKSYSFSDSEKIEHLYQLSEIIIKYKNDYVICLINSQVHLFDNQGNRLCVTDNLIPDSDYSFPTLAPIYVKNNFYYFVIGYFIPNSSKFKLKIIYYKIDLSNSIHECTNIDEQVDEDFESFVYWHYDFKNKGLSCEYMLDDYQHVDYFLICFFIIKDGNHEDLTQSFYKMTESDIAWTGSYQMSYIETSDIKDTIQIKTVTNRNIRNVLVSLLFSTGTIKYYKFIFRYGLADKDSLFYDTTETNLMILKNIN